MSNPALPTDYQIGTYVGGTGGLVTLQSLSIPNPHPIYRTAAQKVKLGDNSARSLGAPFVEWQWDWLSQVSRDKLRIYVPGASAQIYIITPTVENSSGYVGTPNISKRFLGQAWWPDPDTPEDPNTGRRLKFVLTIKQLVTA